MPFSDRSKFRGGQHDRRRRGSAWSVPYSVTFLPVSFADSQSLRTSRIPKITRVSRPDFHTTDSSYCAHLPLWYRSELIANLFHILCSVSFSQLCHINDCGCIFALLSLSAFISLIIPAFIWKFKKTIELCIFENKRDVLIFVYCRANSASQGVWIMLFAMRKLYCIHTEWTNILTVFPHHL